MNVSMKILLIAAGDFIINVTSNNSRSLINFFYEKFNLTLNNRSRYNNKIRKTTGVVLTIEVAFPSSG